MCQLHQRNPRGRWALITHWGGWGRLARAAASAAGCRCRHLASLGQRTANPWGRATPARQRLRPRRRPQQQPRPLPSGPLSSGELARLRHRPLAGLPPSRSRGPCFPFRRTCSWSSSPRPRRRPTQREGGGAPSCRSHRPARNPAARGGTRRTGILTSRRASEMPLDERGARTRAQQEPGCRSRGASSQPRAASGGGPRCAP
mmetsp:Transcript_27532/g.65619  ORF Transcript_27532/g.65619 Transcript_27532/m.65619 type:complete len:202 (+) Transcript_27532:470-1075(+)